MKNYISIFLLLFTLACSCKTSTTNIQTLEEGVQFKSDTMALGKFIHLTIDNPTDILLIVDKPVISKVEIKPANLNMKYSVEGNLLRISGATPCKAAITINDDYTKPIYLFINAPKLEEWERLPQNTIRFEPGIHEIGNYKITESNQTIYLEEGAILKGTIYADSVDNLKILGYGIIDGRDPKHALKLSHTNNIEINGPLVMSRNGWTISISQCNHVSIKNVKILSSDVYSDGIDLLATSHVMIDNVFIRNQDDCITIKTKKYNYSLNVEDITVKNSMLWSGNRGNAMEIGWELDADYVRNILYKNIDVIRKETNQGHPFKRGAISIHHVGNAKISDIKYEDIRIESVFENLIWIELIPANKWGSGGGSIENVFFKNIEYTKGIDVPIVINYGTSGKINNVGFEGLKIKNKTIQSTSDSVFQINNAEVIINTN